MEMAMNATPQEYRNAAAELLDIQGQMAELWEQLQEVVQGVNDLDAMAYLVEPMQIMLFEDHGFLSSDLNLGTLRMLWLEKADEAEMKIEVE
jgi:hypothetical protein